MSKQISFIVPIYQVEAYLARCLDSLVAQKVSKEIILIDDGSRDNGFAIAEQYLQQYDDIILVKQANRGVSVARNVGLRLATGKYVYFVDPDDVLLENDMAAMVELADQCQADVVKGLLLETYEDGRTPQLRIPESPRLQAAMRADLTQFYYELTTGYQHLNNMLARDWLPAIWFGFYRTEFLRQNNLLFKEGVSVSEDALFMVQLLMSQSDMRVLEITRPFYNYCHRTGSASRSADYIDGFVSTFDVVGQTLWQMYHQFVQSGRQHTAEGQQAAFDLLRVIAINYGAAYRYQYLRFSETAKQKVRHCFTPEIIEHIQKFLGYTVQL